MSDFSYIRDVKRSMVPHHCMDCQTEIAVGSPYKWQSGVQDGEFFANSFHVDCFDASQEYHAKHSLLRGEWCFIHELEWAEDLKWLIEKYPDVADRINAGARVMKWEMEGQPARTV